MSNFLKGRTRSGRVYQPAYNLAQPATTSQPGPPQPPPQPSPQSLTTGVQDTQKLSTATMNSAPMNTQTPTSQVPSLVTNMHSGPRPDIGSGNTVANNGDLSARTYLVQRAYQVFHHISQDLESVYFDSSTWLLFVPIAVLVIFTSLCLRWEMACQADPLDLWWQFCAQKFQATLFSVYFYVAIMRHCRDALRGLHCTLVHAEIVTTGYAQVQGHIPDTLFQIERSKLTLYGAAHILRPILAILVPVLFESQTVFGEAGFPMATVYSHVCLITTGWVLAGVVYVFVAHADQPREMQRVVSLWYFCNLVHFLIVRYLF